MHNKAVLNLTETRVGLKGEATTGAAVARTIYSKTSAVRDDRPGLKEALPFVKPGDTLVVWKLDRFGRSLTHLYRDHQCSRRERRGLSFFYRGRVDTDIPSGRLLF